MSIVVKSTEGKWNNGKKNITLKDLLVSELKFVDADGEDLTNQFLDAVPDGVDRVTLKASFEIDDEPVEEVDIDDLVSDDDE